MTTHLVIADDETLDRLVDYATLEIEFVEVNEYHAPNGDRWLFRTPDDDTLALTCDFVYPASVMGAIAGSRALRHHRAGDRQRRILPLIAACDLLGIEEL